ncbi:MAG: MOSC domain-containing protein [Acidimicrobiales bacterium]
MHVTQLWRYPIKSVGGERLETAALTELGVEGDRRWGLVDESTGYVLTARREPKLLMATCVLREHEPITTTDTGDTLRTSADWTEWLGRTVRLQEAGDTGGTYENPLDIENETDWMSWQGPAAAWHDSGRSRISLVSTGSLGDWDPRRFRANVVVEGDGEDDLIGSSIRIGDEVRVTVTQGIDRCVMVTRPQPGLERDLGVLRTITKRPGATFCIGGILEQGGVVMVGDRVDRDT